MDVVSHAETIEHGNEGERQDGIPSDAGKKVDDRTV